MWFFPALIAVFLLGVGIAALSLHAKRAINQVLAAVCFAGVLFFVAQLTAKYEAAKYLATGIGSPLVWVRVKFAIVALISPTLVWLCYYVASGRYDNRRHLIRKMIPWMCLSCCLAVIAFTEGFKPNDSLPAWCSSYPNSTSSIVTGVPSANRTPLRSVNRHERPSAAGS